MKVVIDTNVLISGIFWSGPPYKVLRGWKDARLQLVVSSEILKEYRRVMAELSVSFPLVDLSLWLDLIKENSNVVRPVALPKQVCADPDDDKFIACALAGKAPCIISGDKSLLNISGYREISVLKPNEFVARYLNE